MAQNDKKMKHYTNCHAVANSFESVQSMITYQITSSKGAFLYLSLKTSAMLMEKVFL